MGNVYRVLDHQLDEVVALKTLKASLDGRALDRFRGEVRLARRVTHRNVARTFDIGADGDVFFLTMEYLDGTSLREVLATRGPLPVHEALEIIAEVVNGLQAAHSASVVHCDLKPANIMLASDGRVVVTDFGIAAIANVDDGRKAIGTPAYMAPEQLLGGSVDHRVDIFAVGSILFEMLTDRRPLAGSPSDNLAVRKYTEARPLAQFAPDIDPAVARMVDRCLCVDPQHRYPDVEALRRDLHIARAAAGVAGAITGHKHRGPVIRNTLAVFPLAYESDQERYYAEGLLYEIVAGLNSCLGLTARTADAETTSDPVAAGRDLDVRVVVNGHIALRDEQLEVQLTAYCATFGFELWTSRREVSVLDMFELADESVAELANALTTSAVGGSTSMLQSVSDLDAFLRARSILWSSWQSPELGSESNRKLWDEVLEAAPDDPRVLAAAATYHVRAATMSANPRAIINAAALSQRALAADPGSAAALCASATVDWYRGAYSSALRTAKQALDVAPGAIEPLALAAKITIETGPLSEALSLLDAAGTLDPSACHIRWERARAHAYARDWGTVDYLLSLDAPDEQTSALRTICRLRFDLWRPDPVWQNAPMEVRSSDPELMFFAPSARFVIKTGRAPDAWAGAVEAYAASRARLAPLAFQIAAELFLRANEPAQARRMIERSVKAGLRDVVWLQHCPLLEIVRAEPWFATIRDGLTR